MGHRGYSGNHPRFSKRADERYDAKEAYNKDLTASARLHYLENVRHDHDSPADMHCSPMRMHTDAHMRRQAKRIAKKTKGDAQDIYYEMKSKKMSEKKDSPAKNIKSIGKTVRKLEGAKKALRDEYNELSKREVLKHPNMYYPPSVKIQKRMDAISDHAINPFNDPQSPVKMEGKGCAKSEGGSGCVVKRGDEYVILNNKKGGIFQSGFKSKQAAERSLAGYHANK